MKYAILFWVDGRKHKRIFDKIYMRNERSGCYEICFKKETVAL